MRHLGWILLFVSVKAFSQQVIEGVPLSIEQEAGRPIVEHSKTQPVDGQLKLEPAYENKKDEVTITDKVEKKSDDIVPLKEKERTKIYQDYLTSDKFLQFSVGFLNSDYEKIDPSLDNGSTLTSFRFVSDMNRFFQTGFAIEIMSDNSGQTLPDSIRALQYQLFVDYHAPIFAAKIDYLLGLALSGGDYSVRRLSLNAQDEEVNTKLSRGTIIGIIPSAGLRIYLVDRNSIDVSLEYHQYFSNPQRYLGGFAFIPRFSFAF